MANMKAHIRKGSSPNQKEEQQEGIWANIIERDVKSDEQQIKSRKEGGEWNILQKRDTTEEYGKIGPPNGCVLDSHIRGGL